MHINNLRVVGKFVFWSWRLLAVADWLCKPPQAEQTENFLIYCYIKQHQYDAVKRQYRPTPLRVLQRVSIDSE